jgi:Succinylglutamate desuccinylase / Aspartoacylase family
VTSLYHRFDGYQDLKALLEGSDEEILAELAGRPALIRVPAAATAVDPRARLVTCLLHGNEPSGYRAVVDVLRRQEQYPFDLWVLIGNVRAATQEGWFAHRYLDDQEDFNRVWDDGPATTRIRRCASSILDELRSADLAAAIDLHNNTGHNPFYAILPTSSPEGMRLAALCADTLLLWNRRAYTLMEALANQCPAAAVECGLPDRPEGNAFARDVLRRFLAADGFAVSTGEVAPVPERVVQIVHRVTVRPEVAFTFGTELDDTTDLAVLPGLDAYNFATLPAGTTIGRVVPGAAMPLLATDPAGGDVTEQVLRTMADGRLVVVEDTTPVMMTTTVVQTRRDCLFYMAERLTRSGE